jgi:hypothetical protein
MTKIFVNPSRIALGLSLLGALTLGGLGCGGGGGHANPDAKDAKGGSGGADATGAAGHEGGAGSDATGNAGSDGAAGATGGATAGTDGGAGATGGAGAAGTDGGAGAAGNDGGAGSDAAAGHDGAAGNDAAGSDAADGGAGSDASDAGDGSDASDAADVPCTNACTLGQKQCGGGGIQTCVMSGTCTVWGTAASCGTHQSCTGAVGAAACTCNVDPNCAAATDHACDSNGALITCGTDADGCIAVATTAACPDHQTCMGSKPNASCECVLPPSDCNGGANTTFCPTSTTISTCKSSTAGGKTCVYADTAVSCGAHRSCSTPSAGAAVCGCNTDPDCAAAGPKCSGNSSIDCQADGNGCFFNNGTTACGAHGTCDAGGTKLCTCNPTDCNSATAGPFCTGGSLATCTQDAQGCFFKSATTSCTANETCTGADGQASCLCNPAPSDCSGGLPGTFCTGGANTLTTCVEDAHHCVTISTAAACGAHQTCGGTSGSQACQCNPAPAGCTGNGSFCTNSTTQSTCKLDAQNCAYDAAINTPCPTDQTCKGTTLGSTCTCDNTCDAGKASGSGSYCVDATHQSSCANDGNGCFIASNLQTCQGIQTCRGADGMGACLCPLAGTTAGTGCTTPGETICAAGDHILTCTNDGVTICNSWVDTTDCTAAGHVCGTKANGANHAACQCPEQTGGDFYADPVAGTDAASGVFATGVNSPADCRFQTLTAAVAVAQGVGNRVIATSAAPPVQFANETFPLNLNGGVTLTTTDAVPTPANYTIQFNSASAPTAVSLFVSSVFEGFTVQQSGGNAAASAVAMTGTSGVVDTVVLDGPLATGISVTGTGTINAATVTGFTTGLSVMSSGATSLTNSKVDTNATGIAISAGGLSASSTTIDGGSGAGVVVSASATFNGSSLTIKNMGSAGIAAIGSPTVNLTTGDEIASNGGSGLSLAGGSATLGGVNIHDNGTGISQSGGAITIGSGGTTTIQSNGSKGVNLTGGTLTVGTGTITNNAGDGVTAATGTTLISNTGAQYTGNMGNGISATAATLTFNSSASAPILVSANTGVGILMTGGGLTANYLTLSSNGTGGTKKSGLEVAAGIAAVNIGTASDAAVSITGNGEHGIKLNGPTAGTAIDIRRATVSNNGSEGISTNLNWGAGTSTTKASFTSLTISGNGSHGIDVAQAPLVGSPATIKCIFDSLTVTGNTGSGVFLSGAVGSVGATVSNSKITSNKAVGIRVEGAATTEIFTGNDISLNVGGVAFNTSSALNGFTSNTIHSNTGDQITILAPGPWDFHSPTACDGTQNKIYCYQTGVAISVSGTATSVNASSVSWEHASPSLTQDYAISGGSTVTTSASGFPPCAAIASCP